MKQGRGNMGKGWGGVLRVGGKKLGDPVHDFAVEETTGFDSLLPVVRMGIELFHCRREG